MSDKEQNGFTVAPRTTPGCLKHQRLQAVGCLVLTWTATTARKRTVIKTKGIKKRRLTKTELSTNCLRIQCTRVFFKILPSTHNKNQKGKRFSRNSKNVTEVNDERIRLEYYPITPSLIPPTHNSSLLRERWRQKTKNSLAETHQSYKHYSQGELCHPSKKLSEVSEGADKVALSVFPSKVV